MKKGEKKIYKHPFYDKHTILGSVVLVLLGTIVFKMIIASVAGEIYSAISGDGDYSSDGQNISLFLGGILGTIALLALFKRWFYPEYEGGFKGGQNVLRWSIVAAAIPIALLIYYLIAEPATVSMPSIVSICVCLMAGISEEGLYRGVVASYVMRQTITKKKIWPTMLISSILFALIHLLNILVGAPIDMTLFQVLSAFVLGLFLCALFLRSGSLIPPIIFHALYDLVALTDTSNVGEDGIIKSDATISLEDFIFSMVFRVIFLAIALYLTRPAVREEIYQIWSQKWSRHINTPST